MLGMPNEWTLERFVSTIHEGQVALWSWDPVARTVRLDPLARKFWGDLEHGEATLDALWERINAEDRDRARAAWLASAESEGPYEYRFRISANGADRWIAARGAGGTEGRSGSDVLAVFVDITSLVRAEEKQTLLTRELSHRVKNLFSIVNALITISQRETDDPEHGLDLARERIAALSRASAMTIGDGEHELDAHVLTHTVLAPYGARVAIDGANAPLKASQVTPVGLILHELATNAVKHGALSVDEGRVELSWINEPEGRHLLWVEHGGPLVGTKGDDGFGNTLIERMLVSINATVERDWRPEGLQLRVSLP